MGMQNQKIRIGTRGSKLALIQTDLVIEALEKVYPECEYEKVVLSTRGDRITDRPLLDFGGKGAFVEEFEEALSRGEIAAAVHSAKDMPLECRRGTCIAGVLEAADARDVLVTVKDGKELGKSGKELKKSGIEFGKNEGRTVKDGVGDGTHSFIMGSSSGRRKMQFLAHYPGALCRDLRGTVHTRIEKLRQGEYDGIILAQAGLERMGLTDEPDLCYEPFDVTEMVPAAGQGIIAVQTLCDSREAEMVHRISHADTFLRLGYERAVIKRLQAGCHTPVGVHVRIMEDEMEILLMNGMGETMCKKQVQGAVKDGEMLVEKICRQE